MNNLSRLAKEREQQNKANIERLAAAFARNDALLGNDDFRAFLKSLVLRSGYFNAASERDDWFRGYTDALRDIVNGVVKNSSTGGEFLASCIKDDSVSKGEVA